MCRNWKRIAALGLTVILGCMAPMSTMLAAEDGTETEAVAPSDSEADREDVDISQGGNTSEEESAPDDESVPGEENTSDDENASEEESTPDNENAPGEENAPDDENVPEEDTTDDDGMTGDDGEETPGAEEEGEAGAIQGAGILSASEAEPAAETEAAGDPESVKTPETAITRDGKNSTCSLGGKITFEYVNNWGPQIDVSAGQSDQNVSVFWFKDNVTDMEAEAKTEEQMDSLNPRLKPSFSRRMEIMSYM